MAGSLDGAIDLRPELFRLTHNPLEEISTDPSQILNRPISDVVDTLLQLPKLAIDALVRYLTDPDAQAELLELWGDTFLGDLSPWLAGLPPGVSEFVLSIIGAPGDLTDLSNYFANWESAWGGMDFTDPAFDPAAAAELFIESMLLPTNLIPGLDGGGLLSGGVIPPLDASKIISGQFDITMIAGLADALATGGTAVLDAIVNTWLGTTGSGYSTDDLETALTSVPTRFLSGTLLPGQVTNVNVGNISSVISEMVTNGNFDTAAAIANQSVWGWTGSDGPSGVSTSVFATAAGILRELYSNAIHVAPGQQLNLSGWTQYSGFSGSANSIALTVAQYLGSSAAATPFQTIASIASPGASSGWTQLTNTYTVPAGVDTIYLRPVVTAGATAGTVSFGKLSAKPTGTSLLAPLVPFLDASKILTGQFAQTMVADLGTDLANRVLVNVFNTASKNGANLVISPDFEDTAILRNGDAGSGYSTEQAHGGLRSWKMQGHGVGQQSNMMLSPVSSDQWDNNLMHYTVQPGQKYYVEAWFRGKATNVGGGTVGLFNQFQNTLTGANTWSDFDPAVVRITNGAGGFAWTKLSGHITIPAGYDRWVPYVNGNDLPATDFFYTDDVVVSEETASKNIINTLADTLAQTTGGSWTLPELGTLLQSFPNIYMTGYGGPGNAADTWQATWDRINSGIVGASGTGSGLADLENLFFDLSSKAAQGPMALDVLGIRNNRAGWRGMLPSSDATLSLNSLMFNKVSGTPTAPTINIPINTSLIAWDIIGQAGDKQVIEWHGNANAGLTDFRLRVWTMSTTTGNTHCVYTSGNVLGSVSAAQAVNQHTMPAPVNFEAGDIFGIEWHPISATNTVGGHNVVGDTTWVTYNHPTVFPRRKASTRASGTSTATPADVASPTYVNTIPLVEFAFSTGNPPPPHAPELYNTTGVGAGTMPAPDWCNHVQLIVIPGGGKGANGSGTVGIGGDGGNAGTIGTLILDRGTHFTTGDIINFTAGAGSTGSNGGTSSAGINANTVSRTGGTDGSGFNTGAGQYGASPGMVTVDGVPYNGGAQQSSLGSAGNVAGGGGSGGPGGFGFASGGNGARGMVYIRLVQ